MKFSEKYELLETLTTGAIETFAARDKVRGERVLVHIVECAPQSPDQTAAQWALESFRRLAPEPPGVVLETGKYSPPKYAYVVIKPADEDTVKVWVRRYELHAEETRETSVNALNTEIKIPFAEPGLAPAPITADETPRASGSMTQLFRDYDSLAKSKAAEAATPVDLPTVKPAPSASLGQESGLHAAPPWDPSRAKAVAPSRNAPVTAPPAPPLPVAPELPVSGARETPKLGEFTSFFQGPFRGDRSSDMPSLSSEPMEPPRKTVGEFTAVFGQSTPASEATPVPAGTAEPSFTSIFKDMGTPQATFNEPRSIPAAIVPPPAPPTPSVQPVNVMPLSDPVFVASTPTPVVVPTSPGPVIPPSARVPVEKPAAPRPVSLPGDGATDAFMRPTPAFEPLPVGAPSGPSPYTQIISRPKSVEPEDAETGQAPAASAGAGRFAAPSMPMVPGAAPPPMPAIPRPPRFESPPVPRMKALTPPKASKTEASTPPPVSIWPLIITLTVLFFLAVILVLYFALRH